MPHLRQLLAPAHSYRFSQGVEQGGAILPTDAGISNTLAIGQLLVWPYILAACHQITLNHGPDNPLVATGNLSGYIMGGTDLLLMPFAAVGMAEIYHHLWFVTSGLHLFGRNVYAFSVVVWPSASTQDDMAVIVAAGGKDG